MIDLSIDGKKVAVAEGATVLDAARQARVYIPTLCDHPDLSRYGGCRMCVVEIEGRKGVAASCTTPAQSGMAVLTNTDKVKELRKNVLELLLSEHPSSCLVCADRFKCWDSHEGIRRHEVTTGCKFCPNHGQCALQAVVQHVMGEEGPVISYTPLYREIPVDRRDPFIDRDDNLCILCGRCVRACAEISMACTLDFANRGSKALVGTAYNRPLLESGCRFCGSCVDVCPTGTLSERVRRWEGPVASQVTTTCSYCSVGCQFDLGVKNRRVVESLPNKQSEVNRGEACVRGRFSMVEFVRSWHRIKSPQVRRDGRLFDVPWQAAVEAAAQAIRKARPDRSAMLYSGSCTNEDIYVAHKFARYVLKTANIDTSLRLSFGPLLDGNGAGADPAKLSDVRAAAAILIAGADPDFSHPILAQQIKRAVKSGKIRLVVMGPYATGLSPYAACEIRHLPGEERQVLELLRGRLRGAENEDGREDVARAAQCLRQAKENGPVAIIYGAGLMRRLDGSANRDLMAEIAKGLAGKVMPLLSRANDRGALEISAAFAARGMTTVEIIQAAQQGRLDLLYLIGKEVPPGEYDAKFVIFQDMFLPPEAGRIAHAVFPVASFVGINGSYTNFEGRIQRVQQAGKHMMGTMSDWEVLGRLAKKLEIAGFEYKQTSEIMEELSRAVPFYAGATYKALEKKEAAVFGRSKPTKSRAAAAPVKAGRGPGSEQPDKDYPFRLVAEFDEFVYKATPLSSEVAGLRRIEPAGTLVMNPGDAEAMNIEPGNPVSVSSRRGKIALKAILSDGMQPGVTKAVARTGEDSATMLLDVLLDPAGKAPEELCAVRIEKL